MSSSFYITLPASSSARVFPENTNSHYFTRLNQRLNLKDGSWEVAIADMHYPVTWSTLTDGWMVVTESILRQETYKLELKPGRPQSPNEFILRLNLMLRMKKISRLVRMFYDTFRNQVLIEVKKGATLKMSNGLCDILGFNIETELTEGSYSSVRNVDVEGGFHSIFIYSNLVENRVVGDKQVPLLQIIPVEGDRNQLVHVPFMNRQYQKANAIESDTVEIRLTREDGRDIPFTSGLVSLTLHVRKRT